MNVMHICKFRAAGASRLQMQLGWDSGCVMDRDPSASREAARVDLSYRNLFRVLREGRQSAFVFHMQSSIPYLLFSIVVRFFLRERPIFLYDIHDLNEWPRTGSPYLKARCVIMWLLEAVALMGADRVVTVSRGLAQVYYRQYHRSMPVVYNAPAMDLDPHSSDTERDRGLVYFGLVDKVRLPVYLVEAIAQAGMSIDVYGSVRERDPAHLDWFERMVERGVVRIMGPYRPGDLRFLKRYTFAVLAYDEGAVNIRYCLPNKIFQAASQGLPCLVSYGLAEVRIKFRSFPDFVRTMPRDLSEVAGFLAAQQPSERPRGVLSLVSELHETSRRRYLTALVGPSYAEDDSSCLE